MREILKCLGAWVILPHPVFRSRSGKYLEGAVHRLRPRSTRLAITQAPTTFVDLCGADLGLVFKVLELLKQDNRSWTSNFFNSFRLFIALKKVATPKFQPTIISITNSVQQPGQDLPLLPFCSAEKTRSMFTSRCKKGQSHELPDRANV